MSSEDTAAAIDLVARELRDDGMHADKADALATSIVGQLQSRFWIVPLVDDAQSRAELHAFDIPGLSDLATKGRA